MSTTKVASRYIESSKYPIRFDRQHPGSLFRIHSEPSRNIKHSKDARVYRKALDHQGFYAINVADEEHSIVLMPFDLVQPLRVQRIK